MNNQFLELLRSVRSHPLIIAHRGDSAHAPENTLEAARLGHDAGAEAWELDAQLTRDGVAVVFHDEILTRTTDAATRHASDPRSLDGFRLVDFDWAEVRELDAGSWFVAEQGGPRSALEFGTLTTLPVARRDRYRSGNIRIPTLEDALRLTAELDWLVNVEIKSFPDSPPGLVEAVLEAIERTGTAPRVLLSCFDHRQLARVPEVILAHHRGLPPIPRGALVATPLYRPESYLGGFLRADTFHVSAQCLGADSVDYRRNPSAGSLRGKDVAEIRSRGIPLLVYTVNDHAPDGLADHLAALGVDGLFTDDPAGMRSFFDSRGEGRGTREGP